MAVTYKEILKANESIKPTKIKGKEYAEVNQRIKAFRMVYPDGFIHTDINSLANGVCVFVAKVGFFEEDGSARVIASGTAYEKESSSYINKTSFIENCETSAVGRALGMAGFGIDTSVCSAEELTNAINNQNTTSANAQNPTAPANPPAANKPKSKKWEDTKNTLFNKAVEKGVPINEILRIAQVENVEQLDISRLEGAIAYLDQL